MFIFSWLFFLLGLIVSTEIALTAMPWFIISLSIAAITKSKFNYCIVACMALIQVSWFGFSPGILSISMIAMGLAYYTQLTQKPQHYTHYIAVVMMLFVEFLFSVNSGQFQNQRLAALVAAIFTFRVIAALFTVRYFARKAQLQYV